MGHSWRAGNALALHLEAGYMGGLTGKKCSKLHLYGFVLLCLSDIFPWKLYFKKKKKN